MKKWEIALEKFIALYKDEPYIEGAILCGSYASGNENEYSDIDIHFVSNNEQNWRERGNLDVDGFLMEYFINPIKQVKGYMEEEYSSNRPSTANMFSRGKIIFDKNGVMAELQKTATEYLEKSPPAVNEIKKQFALYHVWDKMDELHSLKHEGLTIQLVYSLLLKELIDLYYYVNQIPEISPTKIEQIYSDENFRKKYGIQKMPSERFVQLVKECLTKNPDIKSIDALYNYVVDACGGFDINTFKARTPIRV